MLLKYQDMVAFLLDFLILILKRRRLFEMIEWHESMHFTITMRNG